MCVQSCIEGAPARTLERWIEEREHKGNLIINWDELEAFLTTLEDDHQTKLGHQLALNQMKQHGRPVAQFIEDLEVERQILQLSAEALYTLLIAGLDDHITLELRKPSTKIPTEYEELKKFVIKSDDLARQYNQVSVIKPKKSIPKIIGNYCDNCKTTSHDTEHCFHLIKKNGKDKWCDNHKSTTHNTSDCNLNKKDPPFSGGRNAAPNRRPNQYPKQQFIPHKEIKKEPTTPNKPDREKCTYCGKFRHTEDKCYTKQNKQKRERDEQINQSGVKQKENCTYCGKIGHNEEVCWKKERDMGITKKEGRNTINSISSCFDVGTRPLMNFMTNTGRKLKAMIDSGAATSIIPISEARRLALEIQPMPPGMPTYAGASGIPLKACGITEYLEIDGRIYSTPAVVLKQGTSTILLGQRLFIDYGLTLGIKDGIRWVLKDADNKELAIDIAGDIAHCRKVHFIRELIPKVEYMEGDDDEELEEIKLPGIGTELVPIKVVNAIVEAMAENASEYFTAEWKETQVKRFKNQDRSTTKLTPLKIELKEGEEMPILKPYPMNAERREALKEKIKDITKGQLIEVQETTSGCSPCQMVLKMNVKGRKKCYRMVTDYRTLNDKVKMTGKSLPNMERIFDGLNGEIKPDETFIAVIDLENGFYNCGITEDSQPHTTICTEFGLFQYTVLPQGFKNSPGHFQHEVGKLIAKGIKEGKLHKGIQQFIDDLIVAAPTLPLLKERVEALMDVLYEAGVAIEPNKCVFGATKVSFLGVMLDGNGKSIGEEIINKIKSKVQRVILSILENRYNSKGNDKLWMDYNCGQLLGLFGFYRQFSHNFTENTQFLTRKLRLDNEAKLEQENLIKIYLLIDQLTSEACIALIDPECETEIYTDASGFGAGFVAIQKGKVIAMESTKFSSEKIKETTTDRELMAIAHAVKKLQDRILWDKATIYTDHKPLMLSMEEDGE